MSTEVLSATESGDFRGTMTLNHSSILCEVLFVETESYREENHPKTKVFTPRINREMPRKFPSQECQSFIRSPEYSSMTLNRRSLRKVTFVCIKSVITKISLEARNVIRLERNPKRIQNSPYTTLPTSLHCYTC